MINCTNKIQKQKVEIQSSIHHLTNNSHRRLLNVAEKGNDCERRSEQTSESSFQSNPHARKRYIIQLFRRWRIWNRRAIINCKRKCCANSSWQTNKLNGLSGEKRNCNHPRFVFFFFFCWPLSSIVDIGVLSNSYSLLCAIAISKSSCCIAMHIDLTCLFFVLFHRLESKCINNTILCSSSFLCVFFPTEYQ